MRTSKLITMLAAATLALGSLAADAQGGGRQGQRQPQATGQMQQGQQQGQMQQGQQQGAQKRQAERATDQDRSMDRDRMMNRDRTQDQDRIHVAERNQAAGAGIYGGNLMTEQERQRYREQLQSKQTAEEREAFQNQHRAQMDERARERKVPAETTSN